MSEWMKPLMANLPKDVWISMIVRVTPESESIEFTVNKPPASQDKGTL